MREDDLKKLFDEATQEERENLVGKDLAGITTPPKTELDARIQKELAKDSEPSLDDELAGAGL